MTGPTVVHITTAHPVGDNRILRKECRALAGAGFNVTLIAVNNVDTEIDGVKVAALPRRSGRASRMLRGPIDAWRRLSSLSPAVVHGHDPELLPLLMLWKLRRPQTVVIFDSHEDLPKQIMGKPYLPVALRSTIAATARAIERIAERRLDYIVAATPAIANKFQSQRVLLVQNFPWLRNYPAPKPIPEGKFRLLYIGGISEARGIHEMLRGVADNPGTTLVLAGKMTPGAQSAIASSQIPEVENHGTLHADEIPDLIASCNVGLALLHPLPNYLESQATKIFEYMASGRAFIASDFPAWKAMFEPFQCGIFVDPHDSEAVSSAISLLAGNPDLTRAMGAAGRRAMEEHFTFELEASRLVEKMGTV